MLIMHSVETRELKCIQKHLTNWQWYFSVTLLSHPSFDYTLISLIVRPSGDVVEGVLGFCRKNPEAASTIKH